MQSFSGLASLAGFKSKLVARSHSLNVHGVTNLMAIHGVTNLLST